MMISKKTIQRNAGYKSACTKRHAALTRLVAEGAMKAQVAAGHKAAATRKLQKQLAS